MAAILAIADIPGSPVVGKLLYEASGNPKNAEDEYLPQAIFAATLTYGDSFLEAAPKERNITKADSLLTLTERLLKSMDEEKYTIDRWTPIMFPPDAANKEISVEVSMEASEEGLQGMVMAQGDATEGYGLYIQDGHIHWVINQQGKSYAAISKEPLPTERFNVVATLSQGGLMEVAINGETVAHAKAPSLFSQTFNTQKIRIAKEDDDTKVGSHPDDFKFVGNLGRDGNLKLKKPSAIIVEKTVERPKAPKKSPAPTTTAPKVKSATINLKVVEHEMKFDQKTISVKAGQQITLHFSNPDFMQHNFLLLQPGSLEKVGAAADALARDPKGAEQNYVPKMKEVIIATKLVNPEGRETLVFKAPSKPGKYPFVCTVPGHWRLMNGIMIVQ
jgi:azurin